MKASYRWLRSLLPTLSATPDEIADRLTGAGLEMEELVPFGPASPHVVVCDVVDVAPHPNRDRLRLVTVDRGGASQTVVCGAPNVPAPGEGRVVLAPLGATLPAVGLTIEPRPIGGVESEGMLCSAAELGLGAGDEGILVLSDDAASWRRGGGDGEVPAGTTLAEAVPASHDWVFDIGVTPNRPDALGHVGLARELATLFELPFARPGDADREEREENASSEPVAARASVVIEAPERCPRYAAAVIDGVTVGASPLWLRLRLEALGVRSINNVVDVTNYLLLLHGHPTHAFDYDRVPGGKVVVRLAREGEQLETIDRVTRTLSPDDLLITDGTRPIALAGVMGGADSEIGAQSRSVLFEVAYFSPRGIRRSARRHGLHSEASHRFERGVDPSGVARVVSDGVSLLAEVAGGTAVPGVVVAGPGVAPAPEVRLRAAKLAGVLGLAIPLNRAAAILERLGFEVRRDDGDGADEALLVRVPPHRPDCRREEDLIEEVMRVHGIEHVPRTHRALTLRAGRSEPSIRDRARHVAAGVGLDEALAYSFVAPDALSALGVPPPAVVLQHPLTEERSVMRTSLLPGLLEAARYAERRGVDDVRLFSVGPTFLARERSLAGTHHPAHAPEGEDAWLPHEHLELAAVLSGTRREGVGRAPLDVYDLKGVAMEIAARLSGARVEVALLEERTSVPYLHPRGAGSVTLVDGDERPANEGVVVGHLGPLHPDVMDAWGLSREVFVLVLDLEAIGERGQKLPRYRPIPVLPAATRDLALIVPAPVPAADVASVMQRAGGDHCEAVELFDLYEGPGVPAGHRSLAYHLRFRDPLSATDPERAHTLTDKEVDALTRNVVAAVKQQLGATVRGG
ncbi:MAG: phenylalanine--tRNA ligase subunit beta [Myxococcota bacterium]